MKEQPSAQPRVPDDALINTAAALTSAALDSLAFHPIETGTRRIQLHEKIFPHHLTEIRHLTANFRSVCQGMMITNLIKGAHRSLKFAGEPVVSDQLKDLLVSVDPVMIHAMSGAIIGSFSAISLTPFDTLKVSKQRQTHKTTSYQVLWTLQKGKHFKAVPVTLLRNTPGNGAFFATHSFLQHHVYQLGEHDKLTTTQKIINSVACPTAGILVSYPADLIKTHIQATGTSQGILETARTLMAQRGITGLYHGLVPKIFSVAPRAALSYYLYQTLQETFHSHAKANPVRSTFFKPKALAESPQEENTRSMTPFPK